MHAIWSAKNQCFQRLHAYDCLLYQQLHLRCRFVFMNFLACVWYYVATIEGLDRSWLSSVGKCPHHCMPRYHTLHLCLMLEPCLSWQGVCGKFRSYLRTASYGRPILSTTEAMTASPA